VLAAIIGKGVWEYLESQKELDVEKAYAAAGTPESLKIFARASMPDIRSAAPLSSARRRR